MKAIQDRKPDTLNAFIPAIFKVLRPWGLFRIAGAERIPMERFEELYQQHVQSVFRFALSCVGRREVAEDITSESFLALLSNLDGIDETQLPGWLIAVARNRARDYWRRQITEQKYLEAWEALPAGKEEMPEDGLLESPDLKPVHRICLTLRYVEGMTRAEIAEATGLSEIQVKGHLQYGLQLLRKAMPEMRGK